MSWSRIARVRSAFLIAAALVVASASASGAGVSEWTFIGPLSRPAIVAVGTDPASVNTIFVATERDGVLRSDDGGASWAPMSAGLPTVRLHALLALRLEPALPGCPPPCYGPLILLVGTADAGVFRWDGSSWAASNDGLTDLDVTSFAAGLSGSILAGTGGGGVFKSLDSGATWRESNTGLTSLGVTSLSAGQRFPPNVYAGTFSGVFKSSDGGATWSPSLGVGSPVSSFRFGVSSLAMDSGVVWVIGASNCSICGIPPSPNDLWRSVDGGQTWSRVPLPGVPLSIGFDPTLPATVFVGVSGSSGMTVQQSLDGGVTWLPAGSGITGHRVTTFGLVASRPSTILAGTEAGLYRSGYPPGSVNCVFDEATLCFGDGRFSARVVWGTLSGASGTGEAKALTTATGAFWFFDPTNLELVVKVLDGRSVNGKFWVFYGALTNVEYTVTVTDTLTGAVRTYFNPQGQLASVADTSAF